MCVLHIYVYIYIYYYYIYIYTYIYIYIYISISYIIYIFGRRHVGGWAFGAPSPGGRKAASAAGLPGQRGECFASRTPFSCSEESRIRSGPFPDSYTVGLFSVRRSLGHVSFRGLAPEGLPEVLPEVDCILKPPPNSVREYIEFQGVN